MKDKCKSNSCKSCNGCVVREQKRLDDKFLNKNIQFLGGNYPNESGRIFNIVYPCNDEGAIYGVRLDIQLDSGQKVRAYKTDNFIFV